MCSYRLIKCHPNLFTYLYLSCLCSNTRVHMHACTKHARWQNLFGIINYYRLVAKQHSAPTWDLKINYILTRTIKKWQNDTRKPGQVLRLFHINAASELTVGFSPVKKQTTRIRNIDRLERDSLVGNVVEEPEMLIGGRDVVDGNNWRTWKHGAGFVLQNGTRINCTTQLTSADDPLLKRARFIIRLCSRLLTCASHTHTRWTYLFGSSPVLSNSVKQILNPNLKRSFKPMVTYWY